MVSPRIITVCFCWNLEVTHLAGSALPIQEPLKFARTRFGDGPATFRPAMAPRISVPTRVLFVLLPSGY